MEAAKALYEGHDTVLCAGTGAGKTLTFWIPLLMGLEDGRPGSVIIIVTPLNILGQQNASELTSLGIPAVAINGETITDEIWSDVRNCRYRVVVINPELIMSNSATTLWSSQNFTSNLLTIIFDEAHCMSQWGTFRKEYREVGRLRYAVPKDIPLYVVSATLPEAVLSDISRILQLKADETTYIMRSNDRQEVSLAVVALKNPANSFEDLSCLIPGGPESTTPPPKFIVYFDSQKETEEAAKFLVKLLPPGQEKRIAYCHATLTSEFREDLRKKFQAGEVWGVVATDAFGLGIDLQGVEIVVQMKPTCTIDALFQRFGRAARGQGQSGYGILFVDKKDLKMSKSTTAKQAGKKRKRKGKGNVPSRKRPATTSNFRPPSTNRNANTSQPSEDGVGSSDEEASEDDVEGGSQYVEPRGGLQVAVNGGVVSQEGGLQTDLLGDMLDEGLSDEVLGRAFGGRRGNG
ncbi:hypothetical protein ONZ45_g10688 [Pleurotus djamor]|nr:hypothetical protein ONZ45_g10688 [Pleurotus djamor]